MRAIIILSATLSAFKNGGYIEAFSSPIKQQFSSSRLQLKLHAEQPNNALLSDLKALQTKQEEKAASSADYFIADDFNDEPPKMTAMAEELKAINNNIDSVRSGESKLMAATTISTQETPHKPKKKKLIPTPPPLVFDAANPKAMIAIVKSFIAADFGIQTVDDQVRCMNVYLLISCHVSLMQSSSCFF